MKKYFVLGLFCLVAQWSVAQTFFEYDQAGNRVRRYYTPVPDLTLILTGRPSTAFNTTPITLTVNVYELLDVPTSGPITVKIPKDARLTLSFTPGATSVGGHPVNNSAWTFSGPSGGFYTLTTTQSIAAGGVLSVGLEGPLTPGGTIGTLSLNAILIGGSGGEIRIDNNNDSDKIDYFEN